MSLKNNFLQGKTVLITREKSQSKDICKAITKHGGVPISVPLLSFRDPDEDVKQQTLSLLKNVNQYNWVILTSKNGVDFFFKFLKELNISLCENVKFAVIGQKTLEAVQSYGIEPKFLPTKFVAEVFIDEFLQVVHPGEKVLICKGNLAREVIVQSLVENGNPVDEAILYVNEVPASAETQLVACFTKKKVDVIFFTSVSSVASLHRIAVKYCFLNDIKKCIIVGIGPITNKEAEKLGITVSVKSKEYTLQGMLAQLATYLMEEK